MASFSGHMTCENTGKPLCTIVRVADWTPGKTQTESLLRRLCSQESDRIRKFRFPIDALRSLVGRLLIRKCIEEGFGICASIDSQRDVGNFLSRTKSNKPVLDLRKLDIPLRKRRFNFNVSHHGDWVTSAWHYDHVVGIDVMKYEKPRGCNSLQEYFDLMKKSFTGFEWKLIRFGTGYKKNLLALSEEKQLVVFYRLWALKESFIKAVGIGLGIDLLRLEFFFDDDVEPYQARTAYLRLDGRVASQWAFEIFEPDAQHCIVVGSGPWEECEEEYKSYFGASAMSTTVAEISGPMKATWEVVELPIRDIVNRYTDNHSTTMSS